MSAEKSVAMRYNQGKAKLHYLFTFPQALELLTAVMDYGGKKYAPYNYTKGADAMQSVDCLLRHLKSWIGGENIDPESGCSHLGHMVFNVLQLAQFGETVQFDNRPCHALDQWQDEQAAAKAPYEAPAAKEFARKLKLEDFTMPAKVEFNWVPWLDSKLEAGARCEMFDSALMAYEDGAVEVGLSGFVKCGVPGDLEATKRAAERLYLFRKSQSATK